MHGYRPSSNWVKNTNRDVLGDCHNILYRRTNPLCHSLNVYGVNDFCQTEIHTAKPAINKFEINIENIIT